MKHLVIFCVVTLAIFAPVIVPTLNYAAAALHTDRKRWGQP